MKTLRYITAVLLLVMLLMLVEHWIGWRNLLQPWRSAPLPTVISAVALVLVSYMLRAVRVYDYFGLTNGFRACLKLMLWHNLWNNLLPMRSGELSFPLLMQRYFNTPLTQSIPALLWFRLLDLHSLLALALTALASVWLPPLHVAALLLAWLSLPWLGFRFQQQVFAALSQPRWRRLTHWQAGLPSTPAAFWRSWWWTVVNWLVKLAAFAWVLTIFLELKFAVALLGAVGGELTSVLPVHGLAGAGTYEAGIVAALLPFAVSADAALQAAVNLHLFLLSLSLLGGAVAWSLRIPQCPSIPTS